MKLEQIGAERILARLPGWCAAGSRTVLRNGAGELFEGDQSNWLDNISQKFSVMVGLVLTQFD